MQKILTLVLVFLIASSVLAACAPKSNEVKKDDKATTAAPESKEKETEAAKAEEEKKTEAAKEDKKDDKKDDKTDAKKDDKPVKVCIVYTGNLGDKSYNDSCNAGAERAIKDFGIELKNLEGTTADEWEQNFIAACAGDYDLIICAASNLQPYLEKYAKDYPDKRFAIIDTTVEGDNIVSISFAQNQGSFLAGAAAAMFTEKTDIPNVNKDAIIGWVGGMDIPVLSDFFVGYKQGAEYINPDIKVLQAFAGVWNDPLKGKELTLAQFEQGADIVMNVASGTGAGILEGAKEAGKYAIGVDLNQDNDQPGSVLTSMVKRVDNACYLTIQSVVEGTFEGGSSVYLTLKEGGVGLTDFSVFKEAMGDKFPQDIVDKIAELEQKIIDGEIKVENYEGFGQ
ncbi:MAG: BMP family ABC transporter substrate-binding protein [Eubacteriales bacterium]|nr:BMP family ABC transporter substrate-binding protein [Clostridiales bacterium]MDY5836393.1 BMP family ABC transporter substrate-binding protein [Eubacteriales bacterium]